MAENSKIQWTSHTFNAWRGCTKVSDGCKMCYAETLSGRNPKVLGVWGPGGTRVVASEAVWREPLKWDAKAKAAGERHRVFCASLADVFEDWLGDMVDAAGRPLRANDWYPTLGRGAGDRLIMNHVRERLGDLIRVTPHLDWLLLTKRPENAGHFMADHMFGVNAGGGPCAVPPNVWLGASVEHQVAADERIPHLLATPAKVRFLSCEPLIGPVDLSRWLACGDGTGVGNYGFRSEDLHWVIVGGESGPDARPMNLAWARLLVEQCREAKAACFVKQLGASPFMVGSEGERFRWPCGYEIRHDDPRDPATAKTWLSLTDRKGGDPDEWPPDLRVREFPAVNRNT